MELRTEVMKHMYDLTEGQEGYLIEFKDIASPMQYKYNVSREGVLEVLKDLVFTNELTHAWLSQVGDVSELYFALPIKEEERV